MIDHKRRAVFVHVPKTAGISIYDAFGIEGQKGHLRLCDHPKVPSDYFTFAFVRDPWDRALSTWVYLRKGGRGNAPDLEAQATVQDCDSFEKFACEISDYRARLAEIDAPGWGIPVEASVPDDRRYPHLLPQTTWTHDSTGRQVLDFLGRFESLESHMNQVAEILKTELPLGHHNATTHRNFRDYYGRDAREAIAREYELDLEILGYHW